ncbi:class I SAM-dependent methyltransferase [uncultured Microbacterium sp.]|uniref:class I SAM-dependent methyltransferase n=1 Tax=uncultured Microbacterium sp. TaxID=191216 RepID=UPI00262E1BC2|nr:methyltransferase domain-containing protein [uncultured Microbacterium sp.]
MTLQADIDRRIQEYYGGVFDERARLTTRSAQGPLEFDRVQELVRSHVPAGSRIIDIGGGAGAHAVALRDAGYEVMLIDPVQNHVDAARRSGLDAQVDDARDLPFSDAEFEAAIMLGPLYHLAEPEARDLAIAEAVRVTRQGGHIFAGAISRFIAFGQLYLTTDPATGDTDEWIRLLRDGKPSPRIRFPVGHFHTSEELSDELSRDGIADVEVHGIEGPAGLFLEQVPADAGPDAAMAARTIARASSSTPGIRDFSGHLLGIGVVQRAG